MTTYKARVRKDGDYGNTPQAAALRLQLAGLATLEQTPAYREMCAAADDRVRAESALPRQGNGRVTEAVIEYRSRGVTHGLIGTYNGGCRCADCRKASADYRRQMRAKAAAS